MIIQHYEFHELVGALLPFTRHMLKHHGAFLPIGGIVRAGEVMLVNADTDQPHATVQDWIEHLVATLRQHTAEASCTAVAYCVAVTLTDTRNGQQIDAVQIIYEHRVGEAVHAFFPYKKKRSRYLFDPMPMLRMTASAIFEQTPNMHVN